MILPVIMAEEVISNHRLFVVSFIFGSFPANKRGSFLIHHEHAVEYNFTLRFSLETFE
jgi:hypothetical protein